MDLEVEMAPDRARVAGLPDRADPLASVNSLAALDERGAGHVGVEVGAVLAFAVSQQIVAVEDGVEARAQDPAAADGDEGSAAGGDDVEAFVPATAAARRAELADVAAAAVRSRDREDVVVVGEAAVGGGGEG